MDHACGQYKYDNTKTAWLVTGGTVAGRERTDKTEVFHFGDTAWREVESGKLPVALEAARIAPLHNTLYLTGGKVSDNIRRNGQFSIL